MGSRSDSKRRRRDASPLDTNPKRTKVHAQRKFAQGASGLSSSLTLTPVKEKKDKHQNNGSNVNGTQSNGSSSIQTTVAAVTKRALPAREAKRPSIDDMITFLCFRSTKALPSHLAHLNKAPSPEPSLDKIANCGDSSRSKIQDKQLRDSDKGSNKRSTKTVSSPQKSVTAVQALKKKYQEQRNKKTTVTVLANKVKGKTLVRSTRSGGIVAVSPPLKAAPKKAEGKKLVQSHSPAKKKNVQSSSKNNAGQKNKEQVTIKQQIGKPSPASTSNGGRGGLRSSGAQLDGRSPSGVKKLASDKAVLQKKKQNASSSLSHSAPVKKTATPMSDFSSDDDQPLVKKTKPLVQVQKLIKKSIANIGRKMRFEPRRSARGLSMSPSSPGVSPVRSRSSQGLSGASPSIPQSGPKDINMKNSAKKKVLPAQSKDQGEKRNISSDTVKKQTSVVSSPITPKMKKGYVLELVREDLDKKETSMESRSRRGSKDVKDALVEFKSCQATTRPDSLRNSSVEVKKRIEMTKVAEPLKKTVNSPIPVKFPAVSSHVGTDINLSLPAVMKSPPDLRIPPSIKRPLTAVGITSPMAVAAAAAVVCKAPVRKEEKPKAKDSVDHKDIVTVSKILGKKDEKEKTRDSSSSEKERSSKSSKAKTRNSQREEEPKLLTAKNKPAISTGQELKKQDMKEDSLKEETVRLLNQPRKKSGDSSEEEIITASVKAARDSKKPKPKEEEESEEEGDIKTLTRAKRKSISKGISEEKKPETSTTMKAPFNTNIVPLGSEVELGTSQVKEDKEVPKPCRVQRSTTKTAKKICSSDDDVSKTTQISESCKTALSAEDDSEEDSRKKKKPSTKRKKTSDSSEEDKKKVGSRSTRSSRGRTAFKSHQSSDESTAHSEGDSDDDDDHKMITRPSTRSVNKYESVKKAKVELRTTRSGKKIFSSDEDNINTSSLQKSGAKESSADETSEETVSKRSVLCRRAKTKLKREESSSSGEDSEDEAQASKPSAKTRISRNRSNQAGCKLRSASSEMSSSSMDEFKTRATSKGGNKTKIPTSDEDKNATKKLKTTDVGNTKGVGSKSKQVKKTVEKSLKSGEENVTSDDNSEGKQAANKKVPSPRRNASRTSKSKVDSKGDSGSDNSSTESFPGETRRVLRERRSLFSFAEVDAPSDSEEEVLAATKASLEMVAQANVPTDKPASLSSAKLQEEVLLPPTPELSVGEVKEDAKLKSPDSVKTLKSPDSVKTPQSSDSAKTPQSSDSVKTPQSWDSVKAFKSPDSLKSLQPSESVKTLKSSDPVKRVQKKGSEQKKVAHKIISKKAQLLQSKSKDDLNEELEKTVKCIELLKDDQPKNTLGSFDNSAQKQVVFPIPIGTTQQGLKGTSKKSKPKPSTKALSEPEPIANSSLIKSPISASQTVAKSVCAPNQFAATVSSPTLSVTTGAVTGIQPLSFSALKPGTSMSGVTIGSVPMLATSSSTVPSFSSPLSVATPSTSVGVSVPISFSQSLGVPSGAIPQSTCASVAANQVSLSLVSSVPPILSTSVAGMSMSSGITSQIPVSMSTPLPIPMSLSMSGPLAAQMGIPLQTSMNVPLSTPLSGTMTLPIQVAAQSSVTGTSPGPSFLVPVQSSLTHMLSSAQTVMKKDPASLGGMPNPLSNTAPPLMVGVNPMVVNNSRTFFLSTGSMSMATSSQQMVSAVPMQSLLSLRLPDKTTGQSVMTGSPVLLPIGFGNPGILQGQGQPQIQTVGGVSPMAAMASNLGGVSAQGTINMGGQGTNTVMKRQLVLSTKNCPVPNLILSVGEDGSHVLAAAHPNTVMPTSDGNGQTLMSVVQQMQGQQMALTPNQSSQPRPVTPARPSTPTLAPKPLCGSTKIVPQVLTSTSGITVQPTMSAMSMMPGSSLMGPIATIIPGTSSAGAPSVGTSQSAQCSASTTASINAAGMTSSAGPASFLSSFPSIATLGGTTFVTSFPNMSTTAASIQTIPSSSGIVSGPKVSTGLAVTQGNSTVTVKKTTEVLSTAPVKAHYSIASGAGSNVTISKVITAVTAPPKSNVVPTKPATSYASSFSKVAPKTPPKSKQVVMVSSASKGPEATVNASHSGGKQTAPVSKQTASVSKQTASVSKQTASISKQTASVSKQTTPVGKQTTPVGKQTTPVGKETAPVGKQTTPVGKQTTPVGKETAPVGKQTSPVSKETAVSNRGTSNAPRIPSAPAALAALKSPGTPVVSRAITKTGSSRKPYSTASAYTALKSHDVLASTPSPSVSATAAPVAQPTIVTSTSAPIVSTLKTPLVSSPSSAPAMKIESTTSVTTTSCAATSLSDSKGSGSEVMLASTHRTLCMLSTAFQGNVLGKDRKREVVVKKPALANSETATIKKTKVDKDDTVGKCGLESLAEVATSLAGQSSLQSSQDRRAPEHSLWANPAQILGRETIKIPGLPITQTTNIGSPLPTKNELAKMKSSAVLADVHDKSTSVAVVSDTHHKTECEVKEKPVVGEVLTSSKADATRQRIQKWLNDGSQGDKEHKGSCGFLRGGDSCTCEVSQDDISNLNSLADVCVSMEHIKSPVKEEMKLSKAPSREVVTPSKTTSESIKSEQKEPKKEPLLDSNLSKAPIPLSSQQMKVTWQNAFGVKSPAKANKNQTTPQIKVKPSAALLSKASSSHIDKKVTPSASKVASGCQTTDVKYKSTEDEVSQDRKAAQKKSLLHRTSERQDVKPGVNAFSADNESSVYAFEADPEVLPISKPFRRRSKTLSRSDEEDSTSVGSTTSIAVQVNMDPMVVPMQIATTPAVVPPKVVSVSKVTEDSNEKSLQTTCDEGSDLYYIPLSSQGDQQTERGIQGIAVKLGTEGPTGPNQRVVMSAKLITKPPMFKHPNDPHDEALSAKKISHSKDNPTPPLVGTVPPYTTRQEPSSPSTSKRNVTPLSGNSAELSGNGGKTDGSPSSVDSKDTSIDVQVSSSETSEAGDTKTETSSMKAEVTLHEETKSLVVDRPTSPPATKNNGKSAARAKRRSSIDSDASEKPKTARRTSKSKSSPRASPAPSLPSTSSTSSGPTKPSSSKGNRSYAGPIPGNVSEAPVFHPTEKEFQDPLEYIEKIRPVAEKYGICRIVAPSNFKPDCSVEDDMRFTAYNQYVHKMLDRWGPNAKEMRAIMKYIAQHNIELKHPPLVGGMELDLPRLYTTVQNFGGLMEVMDKKRWMKVADTMRIPKSAQDRASKLDEVYCKCMLPYETLKTVERDNLFEMVEVEWEMRKERRSKRLANTSGESSEEEEDDDEDDDDDDDDDECIIKGRSMTLTAFYRVARNTIQMWFKGSTPSATEVETEFWRHVRDRNFHICVNSASVDCSGVPYGFPIRNSPFAKHPWNLKVLSNSSGSILRALGSVMGITVPTLHFGMVFSTCCWYRDPQALPWIEYLHTGAKKIWYGIPEHASEQFREAMQDVAPHYVRNKALWLASDTAMVPPNLLTERKVPLCRTVQEPGQFVVVFPRAYTSSVATGYIVSESVYFAPPNWLDTAVESFKDMQVSCEPPMFSLERLLFAIAEDTRSTASVLSQILPAIMNTLEREVSTRLELKKLGVESSERMPRNSKKNKAKKGKVQKDSSEEEVNECEVCCSNLFISLISNIQDETVYCLTHAVQHIKEDKLDTSQCKLLFSYNQKELNEMLQKLLDRIEAKTQSEKTSKASTSKNRSISSGNSDSGSSVSASAKS